MAINNRVYYATQAVAVKSNGGALTWATGDLAHGVQSVAYDTNIDLTPTFELGYLPIYENVEGMPDIEVNISKALDGHCPVYLLGTRSAVDPTLAGRSTSRCDIGIAIYPDTSNFASGTPQAVAAISGAYINSIGYNFPSEGNFTEDSSFVSNDVIWTLAPGTATGTPNYGEVDMGTMPTITWNAHMAANDAPLYAGGVGRSQSFIWDLPTGTLTADDNGAVNHPDATVIPTEINGITVSGTNPAQAGTDNVRSAHVSNISFSVSLNRENITELGRRGPYVRIVSFPVEVTSEFSVIASYGALVSATEKGIFGTGVGQCSADKQNLRDRTIRIATCEGLRAYLGRRNKLASVNYAGGDAGGGNVEVTYGYTTQNDFTIMHQNDRHASGSTWWSQRTTNGYLTQ
jgi:hypothetical protein